MDIFISQSCTNQEQFKVLLDSFTNLNYKLYINYNELNPDNNNKLHNEIENGIKTSKVFLSCVTKDYSCKYNLELEYASKIKKQIIILLLDEIQLTDKYNHINIINCYNKNDWPNENKDEILQSINKSLEIIKNASDYFKKGLNSNDNNLKIEFYSKSIDLDASNSKAYNNKGYALYSSNRNEEAIECYNKAIELNSNYSDAYNNKGIVLNYLNKYNEALECYDIAIEINPNYSLIYYIYNNKGYALYSLKNYEQAIDCFNKAIEINPKFSEAYNNKGFALFNLNRCDEAIECYNKAIEINPNFNVAVNNRKITLEKIQK